MSKINIVRSIKTKNIRDDANHNREMGWDNRFHLAKLQPYDAFQDVYFVNMRILRDQFKVMEQSYQKPQAKQNLILTDRKFKPSANNRNSEFGSTNIGNSVMNNTNLHGSYNNFYNVNNGNPNIYINENSQNDPFSEEYNTIVSHWEDLGVTDNYRAIFDNLSKDIDPLMKKDLFESEISALRKFSDLLFKISKEIESREQIIVKLHVMNETFLSSGSADKKQNILTELVLYLKNIRITSINIINYLQKIRELCSYNVLGGKYNLDKINKVYNFDKNYLIKMKFDMDFLRNSKLAAFFDFEPCESDPFLLYFYFKDEMSEKVHNMQISEDMLSAVKQGQYLILQDLIFFNINSIYMKNLQKQEKMFGKIKGIYGRDFSQPQKREARNPAATSSRLYSPPKKNQGVNLINNNHNNNLNDLRPSTSGFNNFVINRRAEYENNFQATANNFFKGSNLGNNRGEKVQKSPTNKDNNLLLKPQTVDKQIQNTISNNNQSVNNKNNVNNYNPMDNVNNTNKVQNQPESLNYNNIQGEFLNPIQLQNQRGFSVNSKDSKDVNIFLPNQINPNFNIINNPNNNFYDPYNHQMNLYPNQPQMHQMPYNFPTAYGYGFHPSLPMGFPVNPHPYAFNTFSHGFMPAVANPSSQGATGISSYAKENLMVSSMARIEIIPGNNNNASSNSIYKVIKNQNTDRSHDNSKVIKVKTEEIIAIDKKENSNVNNKKTPKANNNKINDRSSLSIKTDENAFDNSINKNHKKDKESNHKSNHANDSYSHNSSRFTKKLAEDLSIQDEIEYKKTEKKNTQKSLKNMNFKDNDVNANNHTNDFNSNNNYVKKTISIEKTESDIQEEENSQLILDKFQNKKSLLEQQPKQSLNQNTNAQNTNEYFDNDKNDGNNHKNKSLKMQNSIDDEIQSEKGLKNESMRRPTDKSAKYEDSFKRSLPNSNLSENLSYKASKKQQGKKEIITNFDDLDNNKENSIDELIDSKSLKDIENEIHSDFKNDQPVIEESKKSTEVKDLSPKNLTSHPSRLATEMKYEKLEVINEESIIDKSKSNLREGVVNSNKNKENLNSSVHKQAQLQLQNSDIEEDYEKYNNFEEQADFKKQSENDLIKMRKEEDKENINNNYDIDQEVVDDNDDNFYRKRKNNNINKSNAVKEEEQNKENPHETFDSLKSHTFKSHKEEKEENIEVENNKNNNDNFNSSKEAIGGKAADEIKTEENYDFEDQKPAEAEHSKISEYSSASRKNKAAGQRSKKLFEELKEKTLNLYKEEFLHIKNEEPLQKIINENEDEENFNDNQINNAINNKSILKTEEAKPLDNSQNQIIEEEQLAYDNNAINTAKNENNKALQKSESIKYPGEDRKQTEEIKEENSLIIKNEIENQEFKEEEQEQEGEINIIHKKTEDKNNENDLNEEENNDEIQEENFADKNKESEAHLNQSLSDKKCKTQPDANPEDEINFKNKSDQNKITDPDAIEEENYLAEAKNEEVNKSFKSKKSHFALENEAADPAEPMVKDSEQEIIEEEPVKEEIKGEIKQVLLSDPHKNENQNHEQEEKANIKIEKKESFSNLKNQMKINFLGNTEQLSEFDLSYKNYKDKLNEAQTKTFKPKDSIADYLACFNPKVIKISNEADDLVGLCCISFDNSWEDSVKININHISALDFQSFEGLVKLVLDFIKDRFAADEILIDLNYEFKDSNFQINTEIREIFKNAFNFKWSKLENRDGERIQKMALALESAADGKKSQIFKLMNSTLEVNHFSVIRLANKSELNAEDNDQVVDPTMQGNNKKNNLINLNYFSLVSSLCQMHGGKNYVKSEMLEKYEKDKIKRLCRNFITSMNPGDEIDKETYEKYKLFLPEAISNEFSSSESSNKNLSLMKLNLKFSNFSSHKFDGFIYNRIQGSVSTLINEELNHEFHVILTSDGTYTVLITELNKGFKDFLNKNANTNIYKLFDGLYNSLENKHPEEEATQANSSRSIWIPSFSNNFENSFAIGSNDSQSEHEQNSLFTEEIKNTIIENNESGEQKNIKNIKQVYNSIFRFDREYNNNPTMETDERDILIKETFLISIINLDVLADSHISTVFLSVVDKDMWLKSD